MCDWCGTLGGPAGMGRWLHLEREGLDLLAKDQHPGPWDFCSPLHLARWAEEQDEVEAEREAER